jgi:uncharacterized membrane protein
VPVVADFRSWFKVRFLAGFFITVPVVITAYVLWLFFIHIDDIFSPLYERLFGRPVPGLGFLTALVLIFLIGAIATNVAGRRVLQWVEGLLLGLPVFKRVYPAVKQLVESFSPQKRSAFREFVLVEHPRKGEYAFAFLTGSVTVEGEGQGKQDLVAAFVPTNNLYLGDVILVRRDEVTPTGLTIEEGIRIILSAGTATPRKIPIRP